MHIDIAHHFLRDLIEQKIIDTVYVNTRDNLADLFTKGLARDLHEDLTYRIGVMSGQGEYWSNIPNWDILRWPNMAAPCQSVAHVHT